MRDADIIYTEQQHQRRPSSSPAVSHQSHCHPHPHPLIPCRQPRGGHSSPSPSLFIFSLSLSFRRKRRWSARSRASQRMRHTNTRSKQQAMARASGLSLLSSLSPQGFRESPTTMRRHPQHLFQKRGCIHGRETVCVKEILIKKNQLTEAFASLGHACILAPFPPSRD